LAGVLIAYFTWVRPNPPEAAQTSYNNNRPNQSGRASSKDEGSRQLEQINDEIGYSLLHDDLVAVDRFVASQYRYISVTSLSATKHDILTLYRTGNIHYDYLTNSDPKVTVDTEQGRGEVSGRGKSKGQFRQQPFTDSYFYRNRYEKRGGEWQLVSAVAWRH